MCFRYQIIWGWPNGGLWAICSPEKPSTLQILTWPLLLRILLLGLWIPLPALISSSSSVSVVGMWQFGLQEPGELTAHIGREAVVAFSHGGLEGGKDTLPNNVCLLSRTVRVKRSGRE